MVDNKGRKKESHWLNKSEMAKSLGISVQAFDKWGVPPVDRFGNQAFYDVRSVLDNRLRKQAEQLQPAEASEPDEGSIEHERLRLTRAQADGQEIKNEVSRGKTAPVEIITTVLSRIAGEASGELDSLPLNVKRRHPELENQVIESIKRHCVKAQNAIARTGDTLDSTLNDYLTELDSA